MSAISSQRSFFANLTKDQGAIGTSLGSNAGKALKEAQSAFFRPAEAVQEPVAEPKALELDLAPTAPVIKRPGSYLDIRV